MRLVETNQGRPERVARAALGVGVLILVGLGLPTGSWGVAALAAAFYLLVTAISGWDPLYAILRSDRDPH